MDHKPKFKKTVRPDGTEIVELVKEPKKIEERPEPAKGKADKA